MATQTDINIILAIQQENAMNHIKPDFRTWAENITLAARHFGTAHDEIERALEQAFNQGVSLGSREGYDLGLNKGWAIEQDDAIQAAPKIGNIPVDRMQRAADSYRAKSPGYKAAVRKVVQGLKEEFPNGLSQD